MKLFEKRIRFGLLVVLTAFFLFSCDSLINKVTGNPDDLPFISGVNHSTDDPLTAGTAVDFTFECDELDAIRVSYQDEEQEIEYEYIRKGADGKFNQTLWIPKKAKKMQFYVVPEGEDIYTEGKWKVRESYTINGNYSFGDFTIPSDEDYAKAWTYRTKEPEAVVKNWITDTTLEATRKANPYNYVKDVGDKIKAAAPDDKFMQVKMIHDLLTLLIPYDVVGVNKEPMPPQDYWTVLQNKIGVCQGYALTFNKFCEMMGIDCDYVFGYGRGETHAWDIVKIDGKCYLVDCTLDAGYGAKNDAGVLEYKERYSTAYLFLQPELFGYSHWPKYDTEKRQLTSLSVTQEQFKDFVSVSSYFHAITPRNKTLKLGEKSKFQVLTFDDSNIEEVFIGCILEDSGNSYYRIKKEDKTNETFAKTDESIYSLEVTVPEKMTITKDGQSIESAVKEVKILYKTKSDGKTYYAATYTPAK